LCTDLTDVGNLFDFIIVASTATTTTVILVYQRRGAEKMLQTVASQLQIVVSAYFTTTY